MTYRLGSCVVALVLALNLFTVLPAYPQVSGAMMTGTVKDASGASIPNAQLSIKNLSTGETRTVTANADGVYAAPNLLPGRYEVTATAPGFSSQVQSGIPLTVGAQQELNIVLQVGQVTQKVTVTGEAPIVSLVNSTIGAVIEATTVTELPLNGRDWTQLATLQPGVVSATALQPNLTSGLTGKANRGFGNDLSIGGSRTAQNSYLIDGIFVNDATNGSPGSVSGASLGVDAIAEFSVLTNNYSAEYGRTSGGIVNAITKSGTNEFHGTAYEFLRNSVFDSRNYFDGSTIPPFRRSQFGASGGGPIRKDRAFFFGDYEGFRQALGTTTPITVLSPWIQKNGTFCNSASCPTPASLTPVNSLVLPYLPLWPTPPGPLVQPISNAGQLGPGFNTTALSLVGSQIINEDFVTARVDYKFSDKDSFFGSYQFDRANLSGPDTLLDTLVGYNTGRQLVALEETHVFSSQLVNSFRAGLNRNTVRSGFGSQAINPLTNNPALGIFPGENAPTLSVPGLTGFVGGLNVPNQSIFPYNAFQVFDEIFFTKGIHSLKFGFSVERDQDNEELRSSAGGSFSFGSFANFLLNKPSSLKATLPGFPPHSRNLRQSIFGAYIQDDIHLRSNLTINLGLRYEMSTDMTDVRNETWHLPNILSTNVVTGGALFSNPTLRNFEPRVGFAWDPFRNGKTSVRGGFGIFDVLPLMYEYAVGLGQEGPFAPQGTASHLPAGTFPTGAVALLTGKSQRIVYIQQDPPRNYVMQWNFGIQRELTSNLSATVAYAGSHGVHMLYGGDGDFVQPTLTSAGYHWPFPAGSGAVPNPFFGSISTVIWGGDSSYNALQAELVKRMSHGFQVQGTYTWSRSIDDTSNSQGIDQFGNSLVNPLLSVNTRFGRGPSDINNTHTFVFNYYWTIPTPASLKGLVAWAAGGWEVGGIFTAHTGPPFTPIFAGDPLGMNNSSPIDYPNRIRGCAMATGNPLAYINLSCFALPMATPAIAAECTPFSAATVPGTCENLVGNGGRNEMYGPGLLRLGFFFVQEQSDPANLRSVQRAVPRRVFQHIEPF